MQVSRSIVSALAALVVLLVTSDAAAPAFPQVHPSLWSVDLSWGPEGFAFAASDTALFTVGNNTVTAYRPHSGEILWTTNMSYTIGDTVSIGANHKWVLIVSWSDLSVLDAKSGAVASVTPNYTDVTAVQPTQYEDLFVASQGSSLWVERVQEDGQLTQVWSSSILSDDVSMAVMVPNTPFMYLLQDDQTFLVVNLETFQVCSVAYVVAMSTSPTSGLVAVVLVNGTMSAVDTVNDCAIRWNNNLGLAYIDTAMIFIAQTPAAVFAASSNGESSPLYVLSVATGELLGNHSGTFGPGWEFTGQSWTAAAGRAVVLAAGLGVPPASSLMAFDPSSGELLSSMPVPSLPSSPLVAPIGGGHVVVPHAQGFTTFNALNVSAPVSYNLGTPAAVSVLVFNPSAVSPGVFALIGPNTITAFLSSP